jgi:flagellar motor switch protein FliN/FliY
VPKSAGGSLQILVVDDDAAFRGILSQALTNAGHLVIEAADEQTAFNAAGSPPDILIAPLRSAGINGVKLLKEYRAKAPETAVLLSAGQGSMDEAVEAANEGATDFLEEPIDLKVLAEKIDGLARARYAAKAAHEAKEAQASATELQAHPTAAAPEEPAEEPASVHPIELPEIGEGSTKEPPANIDRILDVPVAVTVLLGRSSMVIQDLLQLGPGVVVELDKRAGEPVELLVNNKLVALGEVVVVNETFGVRVTNVVDPRQRIQSLR